MSEDALVEKVTWAIASGLFASPAEIAKIVRATIADVREHEAGIAAAVEALAGEYENIGRYRIPSYEDGETIATDLRGALTSTGAAEALAERDARVRERISDAILAERSSDGLTFRDEVLTIAAHIAREGVPPRVYECPTCRDGETLPLGWTCSSCDRIGVREAGGPR